MKNPDHAMNAMSRENVLRAYGRYAPVYDRLFGSILAPGRRALAEAVGRLQPATILEIGVGTGLTLSGYPPSSAVEGVDISTAMLAKARKRAQSLPGRDIRLELMDAEALTFPDGVFDCVTVPYVLSVTPEPRRMVAEIRRVCRPGGAILVLNHFSGGGIWWLLERVVRRHPGSVGFRSEFPLAAAISAHDWKVESIDEVNVMGLSRLVSIRNVRAE